MPTPCSACNAPRAHVSRPATGTKLCSGCFTAAFEADVHATITSHGLFTAGERVAIAASGGKDSTVLAAVLAALNARHGYGLRLQLLSVDEGIAGYRDASLGAVRRASAALGLELCVVDYKALYGWSMDEVVAATGRKGNCTYCGVFRRQALDRGAEALGVRHVVTGHNADDVAETVVMNLLRGDLPRLARATAIVTASPASRVKRSKPLKYAYEKEIVLYAHHKKLDYFSTECVYSPEAFRGSARALIKNLERIRPAAILDVVRSGEDMARLVPAEVTGGGGSGGETGPAAQREEEDETPGGGCGSANGRSSGGEMEEMERRLREDEDAAVKGLEVDIAGLATAAATAGEALASGGRKDRGRPAPRRAKGPARTERKLPRQTMGKCRRCGYLSSQAVCKACTLLEGLNKNRPKTEVEVGAEEEESSSSLMRGMEKMALAGGHG